MIKPKGSKYFTKLDLRWGYNNVRIKEGNEWKAAFITNRGLFEPTVMFFGLQNSPATFQAMMDDYSQEYIDEGWIVIYMDNILIHVQNKEDLQKKMSRVLAKLKEHNLYLKLEKCKFAQEKVEFLGIIITKDMIMMEPLKLASIRDWPVPTTVKQVCSFLGFGNFYHRFIFGFAHIAWPLHNLMRQSKIWEWTTKCQTAFELLKEKFSTAPVLQMADVSKQFILETDASKWAIRACLMQKDKNGQLHPCGYLLHALTTTERNWQIYDQELYAIIYTLEEWKYLLLGADQETVIHCNHKNLTYYHSPQWLTAGQACWWNNLSQYNLKLIHVPRSKLIQADALSHQSNHVMEEDDETITMLPNELFTSLIATNLRDKITQATWDNELAKKIKDCLQKQLPPPMHTALSNWSLENNLILFKGKVYVPTNIDIWKEITTSFHNLTLTRHPRFFKILHLIKEHYWWPGMTVFLKKYIDSCATCQQMKLNTHPTVMPLMPIKSHAHWPFQQITMDFIIDLPLSDSFDSIFVMVNQGLPKGVILIPCNKMITTLQTENLLIREVFKWFGLPDKIISDRGPQFTAAAFQEVMKALKIKHSMSTPFHPQADGQTECLNQELEVYLHIFCTNEPHTWNSLLPIAEFAHNQHTHMRLQKKCHFISCMALTLWHYP